MKISVIVPFLNEEKYIDKCIRSLLTQNFPRKDYELIFIDNGSTDNSASIVRKYPSIKLLTYFKEQNSFLARNTGVDHAVGEIIAFTDADCRVSRNWLREISSAMADQNAVLVLGKRDFLPGTGIFLQAFANYENEKTKYTLNNCSHEYFMGFTNNMALRADILRKVDGFRNIIIGGDTDLVQRVVKGNDNVEYVEAARVVHLEVTNIFIWLTKLINYGEHHKTLSKQSKYQTLRLIDNLRIYLIVVKKQRYSIVSAFITITSLACGYVVYKFGELK